MATGSEGANRTTSLRALPCLVLLGGTCVYVRLGIPPAQLYHHQTPVVMTGWDYLIQCWSSGPGGLVEYVGAWLTQSYQNPWLGALVLALLVTACAMLSGRWLKEATGRVLPVAGCVPAVLLLVLMSGRALPPASILAFDLALLVGVVMAVVTRKRAWLAPAAFVFLSLAAYPTLAGHYLFFVMLAAVHAAIRRRIVLAGFSVLFGVAVSYTVGVRLLDCDVRNAFLRNLFFEYDLNPQILSIATYLFYPLSVLWMKVRTRIRASAKAPHAASWKGVLLRTGGLAAFSALALLSAHNPLATAILRVDGHARERQWEQALAAARPLQWSQVASAEQLERLVYLPYRSVRFPRQPQQSVPLRLSYESLLHNVSFALQQQGRLLDELFTYPQVMGMSAIRMLPDNLGPYVAHSYNVDILLQLGHVNEAERVACEVLANIGPRPWLLQRLVLIYALKDEPETARVFLNSLGRQPGHRDWARRYQRALDVDPGLLRDPLLGRIRSCLHREDFVGNLVGANPDEEMLLRLLTSNPHNRVAFDFLMAHYLLNLRHDQVVRRIPVLDQFGYKRIPRHLEEAVLMHARLSGEQPDLHGGQISPATVNRFSRFDQVIEQMGGLTGDNQQPVRDALRPEFADTYWFYCLFGNTFFNTEPQVAAQEGER